MSKLSPDVLLHIIQHYAVSNAQELCTMLRICKHVQKHEQDLFHHLATTQYTNNYLYFPKLEAETWKYYFQNTGVYLNCFLIFLQLVYMQYGFICKDNTFSNYQYAPASYHCAIKSVILRPGTPMNNTSIFTKVKSLFAKQEEVIVPCFEICVEIDEFGDNSWGGIQHPTESKLVIQVQHSTTQHKCKATQWRESKPLTGTSAIGTLVFQVPKSQIQEALWIAFEYGSAGYEQTQVLTMQQVPVAKYHWLK